MKKNSSPTSPTCPPWPRSTAEALRTPAADPAAASVDGMEPMWERGTDAKTGENKPLLVDLIDGELW